jgi:NAD-dependent dihydropyrimidine dehydrogenase PreA subunit
MGSNRILFCHCANAQVLPAAVKEAVLRSLCEAGVAFDAVADLCELAARRDATLGSLVKDDRLKIAACYPRAVRALFAAADAPLPETGVEILNMRVQSASEVSQALLNRVANTGTVESELFDIVRRRLETMKPGAWLPWFPVIDFKRCTHCMQCLSFCLFGVFGVSADQKIQVQNPENCKANCPACSRVCPEMAIIFPKYKAGPIGGDEVIGAEAQREKMKVDISALLGGDIYQMLRDRARPAQTRFSKERDSDQALAERRKCLAKLAESGDIPPELLMALLAPEEIQSRAQESADMSPAAL